MNRRKFIASTIVASVGAIVPWGRGEAKKKEMRATWQSAWQALPKSNGKTVIGWHEHCPNCRYYAHGWLQKPMPIKKFKVVHAKLPSRNCPYCESILIIHLEYHYPWPKAASSAHK